MARLTQRPDRRPVATLHVARMARIEAPPRGELTGTCRTSCGGFVRRTAPQRLITPSRAGAARDNAMCAPRARGSTTRQTRQTGPVPIRDAARSRWCSSGCSRRAPAHGAVAGGLRLPCRNRRPQPRAPRWSGRRTPILCASPGGRSARRSAKQARPLLDSQPVGGLSTHLFYHEESSWRFWRPQNDQESRWRLVVRDRRGVCCSVQPHC
jgi:hypothetical protein